MNKEAHMITDLRVETPNAETIAAMEEADRISRDPNVKGFTDVNEMMKSLAP